MSHAVTASIEIDAPAARVWEVLTDLPRYPEWNPFTPRVASSLRVGDPLEMDVRMGRTTIPQKGRVSELVAGEKVCWRINLISPLILGAHRCQVVEALGEGRARYSTRDEFRGLLAALVIRSQGPRVKRGFEALAAALKARAEQR